MTKDEIQRALEYGKKNPKAIVREILNYTKNPPSQLKLILHFEPDAMNRIKDIIIFTLLRLFSLHIIDII